MTTPARPAAPAEPTAEPVLEAVGISSGYGDLQVLRGVSVRVWPGRISVLLGSNGAGKTTTLRAVSGLNRASAGTVRLLGQDVTTMAPSERVRLGLLLNRGGKLALPPNDLGVLDLDLLLALDPLDVDRLGDDLLLLDLLLNTVGSVGLGLGLLGVGLVCRLL